MSADGLEAQLSLVSAVVTTFISIAVFTQRSAPERNRYLACGVGVTALVLWGRYLFFIGSDVVSYIPFVIFPMLWFQGPMFLRYFEECLSAPRFWPTLKYYLLGLAVISLGVHTVLFIIFPEIRNKNLVLTQSGLIGLYSAVYIFCVAVFQGFIYIIILMRTLQNDAVVTETDNLDWSGGRLSGVRRWLYFIAVMMLLNFSMYAGSALLKLGEVLDTPFHLLEITYNVLLFLIMLYHLFKWPLLLNGGTNSNRRYARQSLPAEDAKAYQKKLLNYMEAHRPFLNEQLNLDQLAGLTDIPKHHLSIVINRDLGENFFSFLANYRVAEACRLMEDPTRQSDSMIAICYASGFQSKSAFNSAFKRITGRTPGQYRKQIQSMNPKLSE
ncbi:MAG: helix-turn-helix transcriptional regulator [Leptospiraceae bacterium]|nr:helix-turn-helix transcriptional regulator [Leptospiraceae bacterium]